MNPPIVIPGNQVDSYDTEGSECEWTHTELAGQGTNWVKSCGDSGAELGHKCVLRITGYPTNYKFETECIAGMSFGFSSVSGTYAVTIGTLGP